MIKAILSSVIVSGTLVIILVIIGDMRISWCSRYSFDNSDKVPAQYAAIVLGTSKYLRNGSVNQYFKYRIDAAVQLYVAGKCSKILVSGDNGTHQYNEPEDMKQALVDAGVPPNIVVCDYAGFRTLDSIKRMKDVFGLSGGVVVSQKFHNERAIYIGRSIGLDLWGYNARDVVAYRGIKTKVRDVFSRAVSVLDVVFFKTEPRFYGPKVGI